MILLTASAQDRVRAMLDQRGRGFGIRIGVKTTGCSGLAYVLEYVDQLENHDHIFDFEGVKVVIDPKSVPYINGLQVDYVRKGLNAGFEFQNPNERDRCGCGESFRV
jgi:iron-sulfur cluster assembly protein